MPKSRGRNQRKQNRTNTKRRGSGRRAGDVSDRATTEFSLLHATDAAEVRGDAWGALQLITRDLARRGNEVFWRPERLERLVQLAHLGPHRPRWASSRWILAQAAQVLDHSSRARTRRAFEITVGIRGEQIELGDVDRRAAILDHDWVFREVYLYELGGLQHFLARIASADLIAGADRIHEWARVPMGGFRFLREEPRTLTWLALADGRVVETINLGAATMLEPGDCALGRLVPIDEGVMFETAPLFVPEPLARGVAGDPAGWIARLAEASGEHAGGESAIVTSCHDFRLLTDVPRVVEQLVMLDVYEFLHGHQRLVEDVEDVHALEQEMVLAALDGLLPDDVFGSTPWPAVAATLLSPRVVMRLLEDMGVEDAAKFRRLSQMLAGPANHLCLQIADELAARAA